MDWVQRRERSAARGDAVRPCAVCHMPFGFQTHVLLSCTHMFHLACLRAFEKHVGKRRCPLCRAENYQARVVRDGEEAYRGACATRIQAWWRGCVARRRYLLLRRTHVSTDAAVRAHAAVRQLRDCSTHVAREADSRAAAVDLLLAQSDTVLLQVRRVVSAVASTREGVPSDGQWGAVRARAADRVLADCPICVTALDHNHNPCVLLSCAHVFHGACIDSFERFAYGSTPVCPVCRGPYHRRLLSELR